MVIRFILIICAFALAGWNLELHKQDHQVQTDNVYVTIFVHGIISVKPFLSFSNFIKLIRDNIADSTYARAVEIIRKDPYFYQYHPMQDIGLCSIDMNIIQPGAAATAYARVFHALQPNSSSGKFLYYTFGWSGLLSPRMRYLEAQLFYQSLSRLDTELREQNLIPHYTIVAYSHGGTVTLEMTNIHEHSCYRNENLIIANLWLIGVPILPDSIVNLHSDFFSNIVHMFSIRDRIQPLDCFALNRFFSSRTFTQTKQFELPAKLTQIQLSMRRPIAKKNAATNITFDSQLRKSQLRNADPGHTELWSFGWTGNYRSNLPIYPLPASVLMPFIIDTIRNHDLTNGMLYLELHPYCEKMIVKKDGRSTDLPFIKRENLSSLQQDALSYTPTQFTVSMYKERIATAMRCAKEEKRIEHQYKYADLYRLKTCPNSK